jgi:hypothetical protein
MKLAAAGLTPISPVIEVVPVVEIPVFARITKSPGVDDEPPVVFEQPAMKRNKGKTAASPPFRNTQPQIDD